MHVEPDSRITQWSKRLHRARLAGWVGLLLEVAEPLSPLGAQFLWIAQPTLGLLVPRQDIAALAHLLEEPGGMARLREQLVGPENRTQGDDQRP